MLTKSHSIALPLFGALLLSGCAQKVEYDIPRLMNSNFAQAKTILGKPTWSGGVKSDETITASWEKNGETLTIIYALQTPHWPDQVGFIDAVRKVAPEKQTFLNRLNLRLDDSRYNIQIAAPDKKVQDCWAVIVRPRPKKSLYNR